jgi:hypothetical protein
MAMITLKKDGEFYYSKDFGKEEIHVEGSLIPFLDNSMEIESGVTFFQFMTLIFRFADEYDTVFSSHLGHHPLMLWYKEFCLPPKMQKDGMEYLEVAHSSMELNLSGKSKFNDVEIYDVFHGKGMDLNPPEGGEPCATGFAVEYTPLNELAGYEFRLNKDVKFFNANPPFEEICCMQSYFKVYDVISAVLFEISWAGGPESRDEQMEEILKSVEEAKKEESRTIFTIDDIKSAFGMKDND